MWGRHRARAALAALAVTLTGAGVTASAASGAPAELTGPPRQVYSNGGETYLVDALRGTVQWLDRKTMAPRGALLQFGGAIGRPVVDAEGVLWAAREKGDSVLGVFRDRPANPIKISGGGGLQLSLVTGRLVAFDRRDWKVSLVDRRGVTSSFVIPERRRDNFATGFLIPAWTESSLLPMLGASRLIVVDVDQKWAWAGLHQLDALSQAEPQAYGRSVAVTAGATGELQRIDFVGREIAKVPATVRPIAGGAGYRTVVVRNGGVFVDEVHNPKAR